MKRFASSLALLLALLAAACTGSSSSDDSTNTAQATQPPLAATTAPTEAVEPTTESVSPTETVEPTTESTSAPAATEAPTELPVPIEIIGDSDFIAWTERALLLLREKAPETYEEVLTSISIIESVPAGSGIYVEEQRFLVGDETAHAPGYEEDDALVWYASTIVHDAHHSTRYRQGLNPAGKEAEVACLTVQKAALELLAAEDSSLRSYLTGYVQGLIDGADDPENQYWNDPNRHW